MLRRREVWSYAAGDFGFNTVWQSTELYLMFYFIRQLGIAPAVASSIVFAGAAADWLMDMVVGIAADRLAPRVPLGRWVSLGGPLSVLILCATFARPPVQASLVPYYALVAYLALRCAYSIGNIPYGALTARISADPADHLRLTGARMQAAALGGLFAAVVYALFPTAARDGSDFGRGATILACAAVPAFLATTFGTRERGVPATATDARAPLAGLALLARSSALRRLLAMILSIGLAVSLINVSLLFVFDRIGAPRWGFYAALLPALSLLLTTPLWTRAATRNGPVATLRLSAALMLAATLVGVIGGGAAPTLASVAIAIVAAQGMSVMFWSLVPATVATCESDAPGCAAQVYAAASVVRKLAQALASQMLALTLMMPRLPMFAGIATAAGIALSCALFYSPAQRPIPPGAS